MRKTIVCLVSADHVHPDYRLEEEVFKVTCDFEAGEFFASSKLGCSKTYASIEEAIRNMCKDHAMTNIRIRETCNGSAE